MADNGIKGLGGLNVFPPFKGKVNSKSTPPRQEKNPPPIQGKDQLDLKTSPQGIAESPLLQSTLKIQKIAQSVGQAFVNASPPVTDSPAQIRNNALLSEENNVLQLKGHENRVETARNISPPPTNNTVQIEGDQNEVIFRETARQNRIHVNGNNQQLAFNANSQNNQITIGGNNNRITVLEETEGNEINVLGSGVNITIGGMGIKKENAGFKIDIQGENIEVQIASGQASVNFIGSNQADYVVQINDNEQTVVIRPTNLQPPSNDNLRNFIENNPSEQL